MSTIYPVSRGRHAQRAWNKAAGFAWARQEQVVLVSLQEAPQLMMTLPMAFVRHENEYRFAALLGLRPGTNVLVGLDGRWLTPVVPAVLQHYPFQRMRDAEGRDILAVNEAGLLPTDAVGGTRLYDDSGAAAAELAAILGQLMKGDTERQQTNQLAALLDEQGLLEPWELRARDGEQEVVKVEGLYRVNETKLNELPLDGLAQLHKSKALLLAYCHLLSMQHIHYLGNLAAAHAAAARQRAAQAPLDNYGTISFANL